MDERDIEEFVADLEDPSGFAVSTTAVDGWRPREAHPAVLEDWVEQAFHRCLLRYLSFPGDPPWGTAVIEDAERGRLYRQAPCEAGTWFLNRLRREARPAADPWILVLFPEVRGVWDRLWQQWAGGCVARPCPLVWYCEARGRGRAVAVWGHGLLTGTKAWLTSDDLRNPPRRFDVILRGHPARRRHPIRRS